MQEAEFDKFADEYYAMHLASISASGEGPEYFAAYKMVDLAWEYSKRAASSDPATILDFGAGSGNSIPHVASNFADAKLTCVDVSRRSLELAATRYPNQANFKLFDGSRLPLADESFDIAFAACVFHHIPHEDHVQLLGEWHRVLRPGGMALVYEHNPYNPLTRRVVSQCEFDANAHLISARAMRRSLLDAGFASAHIRYRVFFPHALRVLRPWERSLAAIPLGAQYYVVATRSGRSAEGAPQ